MLNFTINVSMRNSSYTIRNINKHGRYSFPSNLCGRDYQYLVLVKPYTLKALIKELSYFAVRLAKVLKLRSYKRTFCPNCMQGGGDNVIKLSSEITSGCSTIC